MNQNPEVLIEEYAKTMAEQMVQAAGHAQSEEDIRHAVNTLIDEFIKRGGLSVKGRHEYGLAGGRIDSKYGGVVIEYKSPKGSGRIAEDKNAPGTRAVVKQIEQRFRDLQSEEQVGMERILGVGCDGDTFVFVRMRGREIEAEPPQPVTPQTVERLLRAIVSLGARGLSFTPENLAAHFGSEGQSAREGVHAIHELIRTTDSPKAQTFFRQWQILFGEVCGYDIHGQNAKISKLADHYMVTDPRPSELLFAVHTYYAIFMKLLAAEIVATFSPLGTSTLKRLIAAPTSAKLRNELRSIEQGGIWSQLGIRNFLEGDLFAWYLDAWNDGCEKAVRSMTSALDRFDPTTLSVDPAESRDLLKQLYQQLFPKSVRHDLGEYYTPDWLAELVLDELGYDGNPDKRLLDPACGSGTFLVMALNRVKAWYDEHRHECGFGEDELLRKILLNIIGFDLNPLAVMAARTNYLMSIRDLLRHGGDIELPVYLCDSIMTPSMATAATEISTNDSKKAKADKLMDTIWTKGKPASLKTAAGVFLIPKEIAWDRTQLARYADILEFCIRNRYKPDEFLDQCRENGVPSAEVDLHKELYRHLQRLDADNKNGVWARIIKNAFAPLFVGKVDYVAGNPPWVNWENLPEEYRDGMKPLWVEYGLFTLTGHAARLGGGKKDLSMIFTYSAVDNYLGEGGRLGFVITQSVFKTQGAGDGFRQLEYKKNGNTFYLKPIEVEDLSAIQVFEGATNRTAVFVCEKRKKTFKYPVSYTVWRGPSRISQEVSLSDARKLVTTSKMGALPVDPNKPTSPWLTAPKKALTGIQKVIGQSYYKAYAGCCTWLNSVYWIRILDKRPNGDLLIENLHDVGKIEVQHVQTVIEPDLVYPLLRGRDVKRWHAEPSAYIILAQDPETRTGIPEAEMKRRWPKTFAYLRQFEGDPKKPARGTLRGRSGYKQYFKPSDPFYTMYNVGPYTMMPLKVFWRQFIPQIRMSQCLPISDPFLGERVPLTQHVVTFCSFENLVETFFFSACGNSSPATLLHSVSSTGKSFGQPLILGMIRIPKYSKSNKTHTRLAKLSRECHEAARKNKPNLIEQLEMEIDEGAASLWGITPAELKAIQKALDEM